jgi:hypothetical protein
LTITTTIEELRAEIERLRQQAQWLMEPLKLAKHQRFGTSSEKTSPEQLSLFNETEVCADLTAPEPELTEVKSHTRKKTRLTTDKLPEDLPVEEVVHELPEGERACPDCGNELHKMGREIRDELKHIPAHAVIVRHIQYVYACRNYEDNSVVSQNCRGFCRGGSCVRPNVCGTEGGHKIRPYEKPPSTHV